jgi:hypothetical protein
VRGARVSTEIASSTLAVWHLALRSGAAGRRVRGGPEVQSATRRAGTVAPRLRGALIQNRQIRQLVAYVDVVSRLMLDA